MTCKRFLAWVESRLRRPLNRRDIAAIFYVKVKGGGIWGRKKLFREMKRGIYRANDKISN
jgi:hypothetical protein